MYKCECGAINVLRRPKAKPLPKHTNEWTGKPGTVTLEEAPHRGEAGGYHAGHHLKARKPKAVVERVETTDFAQAIELVELEQRAVR